MLLLTLLLETETGKIPNVFIGLGALVIMLLALGWVVAMGSGRPHNK